MSRKNCTHGFSLSLCPTSLASRNKSSALGQSFLQSLLQLQLHRVCVNERGEGEGLGMRGGGSAERGGADGRSDGVKGLFVGWLVA